MSRTAGPAGEPAEVVEQLLEAERAAVSKLGFEVVADLLIRVEFRRVSGKALKLKARMAGQDLGDGGSAVNRAAVPQQEDRAAPLAQPPPQAGGDLELGEVVEVAVAVQPAALAHGTDGHGGDGRELVARVAVHQQRGLAARRPGAAHRGHQQEATFVQERQMRAQAPGFFLSATPR